MCYVGVSKRVLRNIEKISPGLHKDWTYCEVKYLRVKNIILAQNVAVNDFFSVLLFFPL
jgi:hypothetical protein